MLSTSTWLIDRTLSGATTPDQSGPGSDGNKRVLRIPQSCCNTGTSPLDCLVSYQGHSLGMFSPSAEIRSVYSAVPADWMLIEGGSYPSAEMQSVYSIALEIKESKKIDEYVWIPWELSSSSWCRAVSTDTPDPLSPLLPIVHHLWQVFRATSRILT